MKDKQTKRREIRDDEIAKSLQSHSSERRRGAQVRQTIWEGKTYLFKMGGTSGVMLTSNLSEN
jgi:hypothetical protein